MSMFWNIILFHIHHHLCEICDCNYDKPFSGKTVTAVGDLLQLSPVKSCFVFTRINGPLGDMLSLSEVCFKCVN